MTSAIKSLSSGLSVIPSRIESKISTVESTPRCIASKNQRDKYPKETKLNICCQSLSWYSMRSTQRLVIKWNQIGHTCPGHRPNGSSSSFGFAPGTLLVQAWSYQPAVLAAATPVSRMPRIVESEAALVRFQRPGLMTAENKKDMCW